MKTHNEHTDDEFPMLDSLKNKTGFSTPEGYFNTLEDSIMNQIQKKPKGKKISLYKTFAYAASIVILMGISSILFFGREGQSIEDDFEELTVSEFMESFSEIDLELDESLTFDEMAMN